MVLKQNGYKIEISNSIIISRLKKLLNQTYKLLPEREENLDWEKPLETLIEEFFGMDKLLTKEYHEKLFAILCKLKGLSGLKEEKDFPAYRRIIFECLNLIQEMIDLCQEDQTI